ncbi:MAG: AbrB family transcriptional regulator [Actinobacteria bacterium]|nr:AbrB family transcriptional regulator [Actinomycetota bacterium]
MTVKKTYIVTIQGRGVISLPADLRRRHRLDEPGAQLQLVEAKDGTIELIPLIAIPASQRWFWTERWRVMEREVDEDIGRGEVTTAEAEEFLGLLDDLVDERDG